MPATPAQINRLLAELKALRASCLAMEKEFEILIAQVPPRSRRSVQNLLDYLALRKHDLRDLQVRLATLGLSSLGRSESSTLASVEAVLSVLEHLSGKRRSKRPPTPPPSTLSKPVPPRSRKMPTICSALPRKAAPCVSW